MRVRVRVRVDVVRLVEDDHILRQLDVECAACARVDEVVVRHEEHLGLALQLARVVEGAQLLVKGRGGAPSAS